MSLHASRLRHPCPTARTSVPGCAFRRSGMNVAKSLFEPTTSAEYQYHAFDAD